MYDCEYKWLFTQILFFNFEFCIPFGNALRCDLNLHWNYTYSFKFWRSTLAALEALKGFTAQKYKKEKILKASEKVFLNLKEPRSRFQVAWRARAWSFLLIRNPRIDSNEPVPLGCEASQASTILNQFLASIDCLKIPAQYDNLLVS